MKLRRRPSRKDIWEQEQRTHQLEHASSVTLTVPCQAVGHSQFMDTYSHWIGMSHEHYMDDEWRKLAIATGREW